MREKERKRERERERERESAKSKRMHEVHRYFPNRYNYCIPGSCRVSNNPSLLPYPDILGVHVHDGHLSEVDGAVEDVVP